jgi:hypothetical protein
MFKLDRDLLAELGLGSLSEAEMRTLLRSMYEAIEMRVGIELAERMTDAQLDEFGVFFETRDDEGAFAFLERNFPDYREIVQAQFERVKRETLDAVPTLLAASSGR